MASNKEGTDSALSFPLRVQGIREQIDTHFTRVHQLLEARRCALIERLEEIFRDFESKSAAQRAAISELEDLKTHTNTCLKENLVKDFVSQHNEQVDGQIQTLKLAMESTPQPEIAWRWRESRVSEIIAGLGEIETDRGGCLYNRTRSQYNHNSNKSSAINGVHKEMNISGGIAIDRDTDNIYAVEFDCNKLVVFSPRREFLFTFGHDSNNESAPQGIAVHKDRVYVTRWRSHELQMYTLEGKLIHRVGKKGTEKGTFKFPYGISVDEDNGEVYVCDLKNNRVQIFLTDLSFKCIFDNVKLYHPLDVKVREESVFILDQSSPCMHIFAKNGDSIGDIITRGKQDQQTVNPWYFEVDLNNHILMTDYSKHCIIIFNQEGERLYQIGGEGEGEGQSEFSEPSGIAISNEGSVIVACRKNVGCLQVF